ncbi:hypothetical protein EMCRGX_G030245 [Ephydatia muelleri]
MTRLAPRGFFSSSVALSALPVVVQCGRLSQVVGAGYFVTLGACKGTEIDRAQDGLAAVGGWSMVASAQNSISVVGLRRIAAVEDRSHEFLIKGSEQGYS